jgi:hypothetical protein
MQYEVWSSFGSVKGECLDITSNVSDAMYFAERAVYNGYKNVAVMAFDENGNYLHQMRVTDVAASEKNVDILV